MKKEKRGKLNLGKINFTFFLGLHALQLMPLIIGIIQCYNFLLDFKLNELFGIWRTIHQRLYLLKNYNFDK
jgi:hypothetical protein